MAITIATLIAAGLAPTQARQFAEPLAAACEHFGLRTPLRQAALIGQCRVESANFTQLEENLYYSTPERVLKIFPSKVKTLYDAQSLCKNPKALANRVYSDRLGNGNEASGDGWRFRGRGLIQLTGRANYAAFGAVGDPQIWPPEEVALMFERNPIGTACMTAAWFMARAIPEMDSSDWDGVTRKVNGPRMLEAAQRRQYTEQALQALR